MSYEIAGIKQYEAHELKEILETKEPNQVIIDVREPEEYDAAHIPNVPLIPLQQLPTFVDQLDKNYEYIFVCRSGNRSQHAALFLKQSGFSNVSNYADGMLGWTGDVKTGMEKVVQDVADLY